MEDYYAYDASNNYTITVTYNLLITYTNGKDYYEMTFTPGGMLLQKFDENKNVTEEFSGEELVEKVKFFIDNYVLDEELEKEQAEGETQ